MGGVDSFGLAVLVAALAGIAAVLSSRASERLRIPAPAFFLIAAALASDICPWLGRLSHATVMVGTLRFKCKPRHFPAGLFSRRSRAIPKPFS
ncbi:MAG TPA: hypothetical protein VMU94_11535 [Streptosporangiaceae bacterium]|nr:hypothetical protein [Streptosporangiaceae bacterium]